MQHVDPRIFRSLEKQNGKAGFDTIVFAALESYLTLREPNERQALDLSRLIVPSWDRISHDARVAIADALVACAIVPTALAEKLEALGHLPQALGIAGPDRASRSRKVAAQKVVVSTPASAELAEANDPAPEHLSNAETVRETLRRLVQPGLAATRPLAGAGTEVPKTLADILDIARSNDCDLAYDAICRWMRLAPQQGEAMASDPSGLVLIRVLRACRATEADALSLVVLLKPAISLDADAFEAIKQNFRELVIDECRTALGLPSVLPQMALPERRRADRSATVRASEDAPRLTFGRRSVPPTIGRIGAERG